MKEILCYLFGHRYRLHRKITNSVRELKCNRCQKLFAMNDCVRVVLPLDFELLELHNELIKSKP